MTYKVTTISIDDHCRNNWTGTNYSLIELSRLARKGWFVLINEEDQTCEIYSHVWRSEFKAGIEYR